MPSKNKNKNLVLCSACLLGINCRFDGNNKLKKKLLKLADKYIFIPVCPEQLGGLKTPREASEKRGKRFFSYKGKDVTANFIKGAKETLKIAKLFKVKTAILKQKSAACGCGQIYDGTFSNKIIKGNGIAADMLLTCGVKVITEKDI